ncbi:solute carrier family 13 member 2-like [Trichomycterus rosablanca]|uniref:solute carrier family 13 member 2-like n=1 Tax=Trichomycterus rosablanca TaxID=2290929 RepID=UPI002F35035B
MAKCIKWLWDYRNYVITFLTPLLLLPLPVIVNTSEAKCGYVLILMALYWCTECIPLAVTALLPVIFFPMMGIMKADQVSVQYLSDTAILGVGGLMVAIAVEYWKLHERLAIGVLLLVGIRPAFLMMGFMIITGFLSMWISSMACTAIVLPIVSAILEHIRKTETEAEEKELKQSRANEAFNIRPGNQQQILLLAEKDVSPEEDLRIEQRRVEMEQKYLNITKGMSLSVCYAASIGGTATLTGSFPNLILKGQIDRLFPENDDVINFATWFGFSFPNMLLMLTVSWLYLQFMYFGLNVKESFGCGMTRSIERQVHESIKLKYRKLGSMSFAECCVLVLFILLVLLWFTREPGFMPGWASVLFNQEGKFVTDGTVSLFIGLLFFIIPSKVPRLSCHTGSNEVKAPPTLLHWKMVQKKLPWNILLLLGGAFSLAKGCEVSKLSVWLGQSLEPLGKIPPVALIFVLCLVVTMLTEICNNVAVSTIILPILASMAKGLSINPLYIMLPPTIGSSFAFMLPVATPPNALTFAYAKLNIMDMVKPGIVLNLLGTVCINFAVLTWGTAIFKLNEFPAWANITTSQSHK